MSIHMLSIRLRVCGKPLGDRRFHNYIIPIKPLYKNVYKRLDVESFCYIEATIVILREPHDKGEIQTVGSSNESNRTIIRARVNITSYMSPFQFKFELMVFFRISAPESLKPHEFPSRVMGYFRRNSILACDLKT